VTTRSRTSAVFVTSAADAAGLPRDGAPEVALVGRSNVGKSSLLNALAGSRVARTSAAPGKTRLANIYQVTCGSVPPWYFVDLPGYGYARGGGAARQAFDALAHAYFETPLGEARGALSSRRRAADGPRETVAGVLLVVDARHPGLAADAEAGAWLAALGYHILVVVSKIDKLSRSERARALAAFDSMFTRPVLPVSAVSHEGLDALWKQIINQVSAGGSRPAVRAPSSWPR
jgi:GTP-binding protein